MTQKHAKIHKAAFYSWSLSGNSPVLWKLSCQFLYMGKESASHRALVRGLRCAWCELLAPSLPCPVRLGPWTGLGHLKVHAIFFKKTIYWRKEEVTVLLRKLTFKSRISFLSLSEYRDLQNGVVQRKSSLCASSIATAWCKLTSLWDQRWGGEDCVWPDLGALPHL